MKQTAKALGLTLALATSTAAAADEIKVGVIAPFSGPFAQYGIQYQQAIEVYQAQHGTRAGDHEISFIYKDVGGVNPDQSRSLAQELLIRRFLPLPETAPQAGPCHARVPIRASDASRSAPVWCDGARAKPSGANRGRDLPRYAVKGGATRAIQRQPGAGSATYVVARGDSVDRSTHERLASA